MRYNTIGVDFRSSQDQEDDKDSLQGLPEPIKQGESDSDVDSKYTDEDPEDISMPSREMLLPNVS